MNESITRKLVLLSRNHYRQHGVVSTIAGLLRLTYAYGIHFLVWRLLGPTRAIRVLNLSSMARREIIRSAVYVTNTLSGFHYQDTSVCNSRTLSNLPVNDEGMNIFASRETDRRYEWLRRAVQNHPDSSASVWYLPNILFQTISECYLSEYERGPIGFDTSREGFDSARRNCRDTLGKVINTLDDQLAPDVFVSASLGDIRWRETIPVARNLDIPWVITEREGVVAPVVFEDGWSVVQDSFETNVDLLCCSNERHLEYWKKIGIGGGEHAITGDLKSNFWHHLNLAKTKSEINEKIEDDKVLLLYFAFGQTNYIDDWLFPDENRDWSSLRTDHFEVLRSIADEYPEDVQIIVKGGHAGDLRELFGDEGSGMPDNVLTLGSGYQALDLIYNSDIIFGFQTTALIESMFTESPIVFGAWGDLYDDIADRLLPFHRTDAVVQPDSKVALRHVLEQYIEDPSTLVVPESTMAARRSFRREYYFNVGATGVKTYNAIKQLVMDCEVA